MTERLSTLRLLALILVIAAGFMLEAKASDHRALADKAPAETAETV